MTQIIYMWVCKFHELCSWLTNRELTEIMQTQNLSLDLCLVFKKITGLKILGQKMKFKIHTEHSGT